LPSSLTKVVSSTLVCSTSPPVSVCGTGARHLARGFSRQCGFNPCGLERTPRLPITSQSTAGRICLSSLPTGLEGLRPRTYPPASPHRSVTAACGTGILTRCPSPTRCRLGLGPPHPQLISMAAEPSGIRWEGFAPSSRYSCRHSHSPALQRTFQSTFAAAGDAPLPETWLLLRGFGARLSPGGLSVPRHDRPVSYYALFQGWLLLSQPPGCLCAATALPTQSGLGDLSRRSGLFPFRRWTLAPTVSLPGPTPRHSAFGSGR
jgi:hypothetical protein